ncbi:MAG: DUF63 family protein [Candidatus Poseidoniaceae archaeon]|jgi:uncharacterized membrane protein
MSSTALNEHLESADAALPDVAYSGAERIAIWAVLVLIATIVTGLVLANEAVWDEGLKPIVWDPIVKDAGVAGDAGYSPQNTAIYTGSMLVCVVILQALFRRVNVPCDDRMTVALVVWVCLAPVLRVLEDADFFTSEMDVLFISPLIHLHLAAWLIFIAVISQWFAGQWDGATTDRQENKIRVALLPILMITLLFHWGFLYQPAYIGHDAIGFFWILLGAIGSFIVLIAVLLKTRNWPAMTRGMLSFGSAAVVLGLGHWAQFLATPWAQESSRVLETTPIWPLFVVLGLPALVCVVLYTSGIEDLRQLKLCGHEAGVLPEGVRLTTWEDAGDLVKAHPVSLLSKKGLLATPMVLAMVFGQLCDGFATMVGIDSFGYGEKHPVSNEVILLGGRINDFVGIEYGEGAWFFTAVKITLIGAIVWLFTEMRVEQRQRHLRLLIVLAVLIVGLAPGLRDIGRLTLGV